MLQESLVEEKDVPQVFTEKRAQRSQWLFFNSFLPIYLKLRFSKIWTYIIFIGSVAFNLIIYFFDKPTASIDSSTYDHSEVYTLNDLSFYLDSGFYSRLYFYPNNEIVQILNTSMSGYYGSNLIAFDDKKDFQYFVDKNSSHKIMYNIEGILKDGTVDYYYQSQYEQSYVKLDISKTFVTALARKNNVALTAISRQMPNVYVDGYAIFAGIAMCIIPAFIFLMSYTEIVNFQESKAFLLLTISGAREYTIWAVFILPEIIYTAVFSLVELLVLYPAKCFGRHNPFLLYLLIFFPMLAIYFMMLAFVPLMRKSAHYKWFVIFFIVVGGVFGVLGMGMTEHIFKIKDYAYYVMSYFFPHICLVALFYNLQGLDLYGNVLSLSNINTGYIITFNQIFICAFVAMLLYFFIFLFLELFMPRIAGSPPIGFRNIFSLEHWKKLFSSAKTIECNDPNIPFIKVENISKTYSSRSGKVHALNNNSFTIGQNEIIVLIGPNGCGKSTLLNSMTGTIECDSGSLYLYGRKAELGFSEMQNCIGVTFQDNVLIENLSVNDHLTFFGKIRGASGADLLNEIETLSTSLDLDKTLTLKAGTLSGGQKRKLCIALAFIGGPPCVILDEPTAGIDVTTRQIIWKAISQFKDTSCLVTSHSLEEAESVASRLFVMKAGEIIFQGSSSQLRHDYHCGYRLSTIGTNVDMKGLEELCKGFDSSSELDDERPDTVLIPVTDNISDLFDDVERNKDTLGITNFTVTVEQLEHVILRIIADEE